MLNLLVGHRMLDYDDCIVHVASLHQIVSEKELDFVEEDEGATNAYFLGVNL